MEATTIGSLKDTLLKRQAELMAELQRLDDEIESLGVAQDEERGGIGNHFAEDGSSVMEQERISTLADDLRDVLNQINGALARMRAGTYGKCQRCGRPIMEERLEAFPYVAYCIECQSILERQSAQQAR